MFTSTLFSVAALAVSLVSAQAVNFSMTPGQYTVDPESVPISVRTGWCTSQQKTCPAVCGTATMNNCDANTLNFTCVCEGSVQPNISDYLQTVPAQECRQWQADCQAYYAMDSFKQQSICQAIVCGSKLVANPDTSSSAAPSTTSAPASSSSAATTTTSSSSATAATQTPTHSPGAAVALTVAREYSTAIFGAGILMAFGLAL